MPNQEQSLRMYHYLGKNVITDVILGQRTTRRARELSCRCKTLLHHRMLNFAGFLFQ